MERLSATLQRWLAPLGDDLPEIHLVGGAVRDWLMQREARDIDLMCREPESLGRRLAAAHGATLVPFLNKPDAPCIRAVGRRDPEDFLDLVPVHGGSVAADLGLRDFTINAMALKIEAGGRLGALVDPLGGRRDLEQGVVRAAGPAAFMSDPVRLMRASRFAAAIGFRIEDQTLALMRSAAGRIATAAAERVVRELFLVLGTPASVAHVRLLDSVGVLEAVLPEIGPLKGCLQNDYHHLDGWEHSLAALEALEEQLGGLEVGFGPAAEPLRRYLQVHHRLAVLKLACLLHDVGKPAARSAHPGDGRITFWKHDAAGAGLAESIGLRLKLSARERGLLVTFVRHHMHVQPLAEPSVQPKTLLRWFRRLGEDMAALILLGLADEAAALGPAASEAERRRRLQWGRAAIASYYGEIKGRLEARPLISGRDLAALGIEPGPGMGKLLRAVRKAQDEGRINSREEALALAERLKP